MAVSSHYASSDPPDDAGAALPYSGFGDAQLVSELGVRHRRPDQVMAGHQTGILATDDLPPYRRREGLGRLDERIRRGLGDRVDRRPERDRIAGDLAPAAHRLGPPVHPAEGPCLAPKQRPDPG